MADMKLFIELLARSTSLKRELKDSEQGFQRFGTVAKREMASIRQSARSLGGVLAGLGVSLSALKGFQASTGLQEAVLDVKMNLQEAGGDAGVLNKQLDRVRQTASVIQKQMPFGAMEVVGIENVLLKAGLKMEDVASKSGAAWAAAALATISKEAPAAMGEGLVAMASPFNIKGDQYGDLANYIQKVDQASVAKIPDLVEGMKYVAGTAANMKVPAQDILRAMGAMSQQGMRGSMAGTSLNDFLIRMVGTSRIARKVMGALNQELGRTGKQKLEFFDKKGTLKSFNTIIPEMRKSLVGMTDQKKLFVMEKIFGEQGGRAAFALIHEGAGSWEEVGENISKAADMQTKLNTRMEGFSANLKSLIGTAQTTAAAIFDPWLGFLTKIVAKTNEATDAIGKFAEKNPSKLLPIAGAGLVVGGLLAGKYGARGLGALLKGGASTALGVAEGKALQAAAGVTPVFVTNWPVTLGGSAVVDALGGVAGGAAAGGGKKAAGWMMRKFGLLAGSSMGLASTELLPLLLAGGAGYGVGTGLNYGLGGLSGWASGGKYKGTGWAGDQVYDMFHPEPAKGFQKNEIKIDLQIDSAGRIFARSNDMNTSAGIGGKRGSFFDALLTTEAM
jgi:TP901 family phage tail tape measure protein